jgi:hypothetical protein
MSSPQIRKIGIGDNVSMVDTEPLLDQPPDTVWPMLLVVVGAGILYARD